MMNSPARVEIPGASVGASSLPTDSTVPVRPVTPSAPRGSCGTTGGTTSSERARAGQSALKTAGEVPGYARR